MSLPPIARPVEDAATACLRRGIEYFESRNFEAAIEADEEAIRLNPRFSLAYSNLGSALAETGQYLLAVKNFHRAIKIDRTNAHAYKSWGSVYVNLEKYKRAFKFLNRALQYAPDDPAIYDSLGAAYYNLDDFDQAITAYTKEIGLHELRADSDQV